MSTLIERLKNPEDHYEFSDPKKANAVLMSLCQEAADALADIKQDLTPVQEPVAWIFKPHRELLWPNEVERKNPLELNEYTPLYTTLLAQPAPVPDLTHDQWDEWQDKHGLILEREALDELRSMIYTAAAQPEPVQQERGEPVAWMDASGDIYKHELWPDWNPPHTPLYTTPPAAQPAPASWMEMVTANLVREGVNKHKARELAEHFYGLAQPAPVQEPAERFAALIDAINYERQQAEKYFRLYEEACDIAQRRLNEIARLDSQLAAAQPAQEPVMIYHGGCTIDCGEHGHHNMEMLKLIPAGTKLYDRPVAQKPWVCLTPKEVHAIWSVVNPDWHTPRGAVSAIYEHIETKLKDKNA